MAKDQDRREGLDQMKRDRYEHERRTGKATPDTREIDRWARDLGNRVERKESEGDDGKKRR